MSLGLPALAVGIPKAELIRPEATERLELDELLFDELELEEVFLGADFGRTPFSCALKRASTIPAVSPTFEAYGLELVPSEYLTVPSALEAIATLPVEVGDLGTPDERTGAFLIGTEIFPVL
jgi:hypothetical protein